MCGIAGFNWEDKKLIKSMIAIQKHRGPDQDNLYTDRNSSLGHVRLSIIDLSDKGKQPMSNENNDIWITFNGEIYNFKKIKEDLEKRGHTFNSDTDTEVIVHAYEEYGEACVNKFNGMFAFAIYDSNKKSFFLARDKAGIKPLYYTLQKEKFIFASELKAILVHDIERKVNKEAFHNFLTFRYTPSEQTILDNIKKLPPGHCATFKAGKLTIKQFWDLEVKTIEKENYAQQIDETLTESINKRLMSDVPLGAFLSGGLDSTYLVGLMSKLKEDPVKTFSVGFDHGYDESKFSRIAAETYNTDHKEIIVKQNSFELLPEILWHMDEPIADFASIPTYILSEFAKKKVSVVLTGEGADELFAGYRKYKYLNAFNTYQKLTPLVLRKAMSATASLFASTPHKKRFLQFNKSNSTNNAYLNLISYFTEEEKEELCNKELLDQVKRPDEDIINPYLQQKPLTDALTTLDFKTWLPEDLLMKVDKTTMAFGLEARVPFLDPDMINLASQIPAKEKLKAGKEKVILRKAMQKTVPKVIAKRKKHGFNVPVHTWLEKDLKDHTQQLLSKESIDNRGLINHAYVEKLFKNYKKSKIYYSRQLWTLLNFEIWARMYLDNNLTKKPSFGDIL